MNELEQYKESVFEKIKRVDSEGNEYWLARELQNVLGYVQWRRFKNIIHCAKTTCDNSGVNINEHFATVGKMVRLGSGSNRKIDDFKLSRYACYLIVQNGDSRKEVIAFGQTYFAIQTRKQELLDDEYSLLNEEEKRLYRRRQTKDGNKILYKTAVSKGVKHFDKFTNAGYKGLYNGETANDIAKRKGLRYREEILDYMGSSELGANVFRITQTEELLNRQEEKSEKKAMDIHYNVGMAIRKTIEELGNTMPEDLPTPKKSIKEIENDDKKLDIY